MIAIQPMHWMLNQGSQAVCTPADRGAFFISKVFLVKLKRMLLMKIFLLTLPVVLTACMSSEACEDLEDKAKEAKNDNTGTLEEKFAEHTAQFEYRSCVERHL